MVHFKCLIILCVNYISIKSKKKNDEVVPLTGQGQSSKTLLDKKASRIVTAVVFCSYESMQLPTAAR